jgi:hypothetical protein
VRCGLIGQLVIAEDGAATVMLRADAGSVADDFIGAPVLEEDDTRCALTRRCRGPHPARAELFADAFEYARQGRSVCHSICLTTVKRCSLIRLVSTIEGAIGCLLSNAL